MYDVVFLLGVCSSLVLWCCLEVAPGPEWINVIGEDKSIQLGDDVEELRWIHVIGQVQRLQFGEAGFSRAVILENSPGAGWTALHKWTTEYLSNKIPIFYNVRKATSPFLYEYEGSQMEMLPNNDFLPKKNFEKINLSSKDFFASDEELRFSRKLGDLVDLIGDDIFPREFMNSTVERDENLWIAKHGIVTGMHFDLSENLFFQIRGCKKFILVNPSEWKSVHLQSIHHPRYRQTSFESGTYEGNAIQGYVAMLYPGDLLYIPPGVMHRVSAVRCEGSDYSVSVSTWSTSSVSNAKLQVQREAFALLNSYIPDRKVDVLTKYIKYLVNHDRSIIDVIVKQRYMQSSKMIEALGCNREIECNLVADDTDDDKIKEVVESAFEHFKLIDSDFRDMLFSFHIEYMTSSTIGFPMACSFLRFCM